MLWPAFWTLTFNFFLPWYQSESRNEENSRFAGFIPILACFSNHYHPALCRQCRRLLEWKPALAPLILSLLSQWGNQVGCPSLCLPLPKKSGNKSNSREHGKKEFDPCVGPCFVVNHADNQWKNRESRILYTCNHTVCSSKLYFGYHQSYAWPNRGSKHEHISQSFTSISSMWSKTSFEENYLLLYNVI